MLLTDTRTFSSVHERSVIFASIMLLNLPVLVAAFHVDPVSRKERLAPWEAWAEISELIWDRVCGGREATIYPVQLQQRRERIGTTPSVGK